MRAAWRGLQFTNITVETFFYERAWLGGAEPIHITALPRSVNTEVRLDSPWKAILPTVKRAQAVVMPGLSGQSSSLNHARLPFGAVSAHDRM